jgi:7-cyano-7-deazaguanine synthase
MDSAVALAEAVRSGERVVPVYVRSGMVWEPAELHWLGRFLETLGGARGAGDAGEGDRREPLVVLDVPVADLYGAHWSGAHWSQTGTNPPDASSPDEAVYLPGRNILLLAKTGVLAALRGCRAVVMGPLASNPFPDGRPAFFDAMGRALGIGMGLDQSLTVLTPLAGLEKVDVVRRGAGLALHLTFSCLAPDERFRHCGRCNKCAERRRGFREAGVEDPTDYAAG